MWFRRNHCAEIIPQIANVSTDVFNMFSIISHVHNKQKRKIR